MGQPNDLESMRARELVMLADARRVCADIAQDSQSDEKERRHAQRLISRIDAMRRMWGAHDVSN